MNHGGMKRDTTQEQKVEPNNNITTAQKNTHYKELNNYYENNKETRDEYKKQRYIENREHFQNCKQEWYLTDKGTHTLKQKERFRCECGVEVCRGCLKRHQQSEKHIVFNPTYNYYLY